MPRPRKNFTLRLTDQLLDDVTRFAEEEGVSVNYWISRVVAAAADRHGRTTLGVPNDTLQAHADLMEKATGTRPDTVMRGDRRVRLPKPDVQPIFRGKDKL